MPAAAARNFLQRMLIFTCAPFVQKVAPDQRKKGTTSSNLFLLTIMPPDLVDSMEFHHYERQKVHRFVLAVVWIGGRRAQSLQSNRYSVLLGDRLSHDCLIPRKSQRGKRMKQRILRAERN